MTLGQKIKDLRCEKNLTQKDLADQLHVTFQTISKWENGTNEPDVATLKELARIFDCSVDYLVGEEEKPEPAPVESKTIIIHQKALHVCEKCKKDIPEDELDIDQVCVEGARRGRSAVYREAFYHKKCLSEVRRQREAEAKAVRSAKASKTAKLSFGWGIAGGIVAFVATLLTLLLVPSLKENIHPGIAVAISFVASYGIFSMLYCLISNSYICDIFIWASSLSIKFPGLIFSWSVEGFKWLIVMKIIFAVLGFLVGVFALLLAIVLSSALSIVSFPFILIHNIRTQYGDAIIN